METLRKPIAIVGLVLLFVVVISIIGNFITIQQNVGSNENASMLPMSVTLATIGLLSITMLIIHLLYSNVDWVFGRVKMLKFLFTVATILYWVFAVMSIGDMDSYYDISVKIGIGALLLGFMSLLNILTGE